MRNDIGTCYLNKKQLLNKSVSIKRQSNPKIQRASSERSPLALIECAGLAQ